MLVVGSLWGMICSATFYIFFRMLSMICIDTDPILITKKAQIQATQELIMPYWKSRMSTSEDGSDNAEREVCYRGKNRYVRRLCRSRSDIMGDTELILHSRGRLENLTVSSFVGYTDEGYCRESNNGMFCSLLPYLADAPGISSCDTRSMF